MLRLVAPEPRALDLAGLEDDVAVGEDHGRSPRPQAIEHVEGARVQPVRGAILQFVKQASEVETHAKDEVVCGVCATAEIICSKWTPLVIRDLAEGRSRFCELERSLAGISPRTLSLRLRALEEEGIIERRTYPEVPPRVEYALTEKGRALLPIIDDMRAYGESWLRREEPAAEAAPSAGTTALAAA